MIDMKFQIIDYYISDFEVEQEDENSDSENESEVDNNEFIIILFGRQKDGKTVSVNITDFPPYFYIKVPDNWGEAQRMMFEEHIRKKISKSQKDSFTKCTLKKSFVFGSLLNQ